jgi:hypothetical protein
MIINKQLNGYTVLGLRRRNTEVRLVSTHKVTYFLDLRIR